MNKIQISIIVPIYNEEKNILPLIKSLEKNLSHESYEIIFIDDHSTDKSFTILKRLRNSRVKSFIKAGEKGKAYSLIEGFQHATGEIYVMIDGDLQYSPEEIPAMLKKLRGSDIIVANRKESEVSKARKLMSKTFRTVFGKILFSINEDIQSGLKVFKKEVWESISFTPKSSWAFDLEFLHRARQAGYLITQHDIIFHERSKGSSKISYVSHSFELAKEALLLRIKRIAPVQIKKQNGVVGIGYKKKQFVTHTQLPHELLALRTFTYPQIIFFFAMLLAITLLLFIAPLLVAQILIGILSFIYFIDAAFHLYLMLRSVKKNIMISLPQEELALLNENTLPVYTILCPLYKEAHVLPGFLDAIGKIDYPKDKLDIILLLEEDDTESLEKIGSMNLPPFVRSLIVPDSFPKTKPKACNYGLKYARGEMLVIYDAEDIPDPLQLKKAVLAFRKLPRNVVCLQAQLNYYNPEQNLLTRFFTAEYSLWFDVILPGLQSFNTSIPLGGTSNHFRTEDLRGLFGWDPFNVTEDADLGVRLFRNGYQTAVINSTTLEEANSNLKNWVRQRSRWIKGYMQTYLVHLRKSIKTKKQNQIHILIFHLTVGGKLAFILINPLLWLITFLYFAAYRYVGPQIESLYVPIVFYMAVISLIFGNFMYLYFYMVGLAKREQWSLVKYVYVIPIYWLMISYAGAVAFYQLLFKPHYWEKTVHGLTHKKTEKKAAAPVPEPIPVPKPAISIPRITPRPVVVFKRIPKVRFPSLSINTDGILLILATLVSSSINLGFLLFSGRVLDLASISTFGIIQSLANLSLILFAAITASVNVRAGALYEKSQMASYNFWNTIRNKTVFFALALASIWTAFTPAMQHFLREPSLLPFSFFTFALFSGVIYAVNKGYLSVISLFGSTVFLIVIEPLIKIYSGFYFIYNGNFSAVYMSIPLSIILSSVLSWFMIKRPVRKQTGEKIREVKTFPKKFFTISLLSGVSSIAFLNADILLIKHFFTDYDTGRYVLLAFAGKIITFLGALTTQLTISGFTKKEQNVEKNFGNILLSTFLITFLGFLVFGLFANITFPTLFAEKAASIIPFAPFYMLGVLGFVVSTVFVSYYLAKKVYSFIISSILFGFSLLALIAFRHDSLGTVVWLLMTVGVLQLFFMIVLHYHVKVITKTERILYAMLWKKRPKESIRTTKHILIFNWRDTTHSWAGGAELYIHELAKRFVKDGNHVTLFTAKDKRSSHRQVIDGVEIIRKGGFYTVYFWAIVYYLFLLRKKADVVIDSENGIPFFTPLYVRKPVYLLIHHVHQHVFRNHLPFPLSVVAKFLEGVFMPIVYKNNPIITVSESSRDEIISLGFRKEGQVQIIHPGINEKFFYTSKKTSYPSFIYLGRLKPYKNIDRAITAFASIRDNFPKARFFIVGEGEAIHDLMKLTKKLHLSGSVEFFGKVTEEEKASLLAKSWVMVQPSEVEGFGITVVEANASGTPVIASRVNGLRDSVVHNKTGLLVTPDSITSLSDAMRLLIMDASLRKTLSTNAYTWSMHYHWDESARRFQSIIDISQQETIDAFSAVLSPAMAKEVYE